MHNAHRLLKHLQVCELDIMNEPEMVSMILCMQLKEIRMQLPFLSYCQVHYIVDEMLLNGCIIDTNKANVLEPVQLLETVEKQ